jgi:O-antigen ligase
LNQYLDILSVISLIFFCFSIIRGFDYAILIGILIKSLVDTSWDVNVFGLSIIDIHSIVFLFYGYSLIIKKNLFYIMDNSLLQFWVIAHIGILIGIFINQKDGFEAFARMLYFPLGMVLFPYFLLDCEEKEGVKLIKFLIYAALFSSLISILQFVGVIPHEFLHMSKGLVRSNGFYHDMVTSRIYVIQGLMALIYINFSGRFKIQILLNLVLLFIFIFAGYVLFSKALIGIFVVGAFLLLIATKQNIYKIGFGVLIAFFLFTVNTSIFETTSQLFSKEIEYNNGDLNDSGQIFSGRGMLWEDYINYYKSSSSIQQIIGNGENEGRTHNEFLRILILSGAIGFFAYLLFIIIIIFQSFLQYLNNSPLKFISLFCASILLIDCFSVVWGLYPFYIITIIGFYQTVQLSNNLIITDESTDS